MCSLRPYNALDKYCQYGCSQNANGVFEIVEKKSQFLVHFSLFRGYIPRHI